MDDQAYQAWWPLHLRVAKGETLSAEEQANYSEGKRCLDEEEALESSLIHLRQTREDIQELEADCERLQEHRRKLRERVKALEAALSEKAKQAVAHPKLEG